MKNILYIGLVTTLMFISINSGRMRVLKKEFPTCEIIQVGKFSKVNCGDVNYKVVFYLFTNKIKYKDTY